MLFGKPLPSRTPSPEGEQRVAKRRQILRVEVSTAGASTDAPFRSVSLDIPTAGHMELSMRLSLHDPPASPVSTVAASDQASTVQVENMEHTTGTNGFELPPPAPHGLANFGLSATTYRHLWEAWQQGGLSVAEIRACHGPQVAQMVMDQWALRRTYQQQQQPPETPWEMRQELLVRMTKGMKDPWCNNGYKGGSGPCRW